MTKVYLAGPMRGHTKFNFPLFHAVTRELRKAGVEVYSPAEKEDPDAPPLPMTSYASRDLAAILDIGAVAVLPGWEYSPGAMTEVALALWCGFPIYDAITLIAAMHNDWAGDYLAEIHPEIRAKVVEA